MNPLFLARTHPLTTYSIALDDLVSAIDLVALTITVQEDRIWFVNQISAINSELVGTELTNLMTKYLADRL